MNQRITVRAIVRKDDRVLLLRRRDGRPAVVGKYQLPGGRVDYGEDPQDTIRRYLSETTGLTAQTIQLFDVVSYIDHDNRDLHYLYIVYKVSASNNDKIRLSERYDYYTWKKPADKAVNELTIATNLILNLLQQPSNLLNSPNNISDEKNTSLNDRVIIYSDGGSRGNPGPSASGYVILNKNQEVIHEGGVYLGITTNNQAEYHGVRLGLEKAHAMGATAVDFRLDSLLVVNQMNGVYKIKNRELWPIHERIRELIGLFDKVSFSHVKRELNQLADGMVNKILDAHADTV